MVAVAVAVAVVVVVVVVVVCVGGKGEKGGKKCWLLAVVVVDFLLLVVDCVDVLTC